MVVEENPRTELATDVTRSVLETLDNSKLSSFHWKAMITSGMGFFTDAYDLFIIGVALAVLTPLWHLSSLEISLIGSTSLLAAAFGSVIFGRIADYIGRKRIYSATLLVLAAGAIASALSPNLLCLLIARFILGLGIGGDYPLSATLMSEYANRKDRGKLITMVFSMQGLGLILGPLVAILLLISGLNHDITWRLMLALGAIPALATFYLRNQIAETPRFALMMQGEAEEAANTVATTVQGKRGQVSKQVKQSTAARKEPQKKQSWLYVLFQPRYLRWLIGTAGAWFLLDIAYYGTTISSPLVLKSLNSQANLVTDMVYTLLIFVIAALPGYILAAFTIDRLGRKWIQCVGFGMMTLAFGLLAVAPSLTTITLPFLLMYGLSYFFTEFGPNVTTFVYPAEIFPVMVRSTAHGLSAALGKVGAFIGAFAFPYLLNTFHLPGAMAFAAIMSVIGLVLTLSTLPEPNGRSLEEISDEHAVLAAHKEKERIA
ncbi:MFS transporter [Ktedonosporobacter rubrisoli]|uniref:MFS transporter n=1 Tax=Ktedonosporobacter rubrisoli TaxID=2509675 RepID=A0A4P6K0J9_KTERU|nr:MFS transporter [Ktedonosporobacter rubrisoli]QBD81564.1 MFS transporter [Ktedonosporobacter rubrisoli]